jgi:hypothetical protein
VHEALGASLDAAYEDSAAEPPSPQRIGLARQPAVYSKQEAMCQQVVLSYIEVPNMRGLSREQERITNPPSKKR